MTHHLDIFLQAKKGKKSAKKATLAGTSAKAGRKDDLDAFGGGNYDYGDEFDDFMWHWLGQSKRIKWKVTNNTFKL